MVKSEPWSCNLVYFRTGNFLEAFSSGVIRKHFEKCCFTVDKQGEGWLGGWQDIRGWAFFRTAHRPNRGRQLLENVCCWKLASCQQLITADAKSKTERVWWCGTLWHSSARPHQLARQQGGQQGRCAGGWRLPGLQQLCPCSWGPSAHGTAPPGLSACSALTTAACGRAGGSLEVSLPLSKQCKSWRFWGFCCAGELFRCKGSNWSSVKTFLFVFGHAKVKTIWWPQCLKIYTKTNACSCIYSSLLETGGNSSCSSLKVIVPNLSNNKILIRVTGIILIYPWESAKVCITLQACCQILVSAKDALDLWSWSFLVL